MILLSKINDIYDLKENLLSIDNDFKSTLIKEENKLTYFNIFLFYTLMERKSILFEDIQSIFNSEENLIRKFISVNYLSEKSFETDDILLLSSNRANAIKFTVIEGLFVLIVLYGGEEKELAFPSFKYLSEFLDDGSCILYNDKLQFNKELISGLFYI